jgi:tetratricopeptide (TPR) repeat protein
MVLSVKDTEGHPLRGVQLGIEGIGTSGLTGSDGKVRVRLGSAAEEGDYATLIIESSPKGRDYVMISPWDRRTQIPRFADKPENYVQVVLIQRGDRAALENGAALRSLAQQITTSSNSKGSYQSEPLDPKEALKLIARRYGLTAEDLDRAIREWGAKAEDPYDKGLADFYDRNYPKASSEFQKSLSEREEKLSVAKDQAAEAAFFLGTSLYSEGKYQKSADAFLKCQELRPDDLYVLYTRALSLSDAGDYDTAKALSDKALTIAERTLKPDDPVLATALDNAGHLLVLKNEPTAGEALYRRAIAIDKKSLGPINHNLAASLNGLGVSLENQHKFAEAKSAYDEAISMDDAILGTDNLESASYRNNRALLLDQMGNHEMAEQEFRGLLALREAAQGPEHPAVAATLQALSRTLIEEQRLGEAEPFALRALKIDEEVFGPDDPRIGSALYQLATLLSMEGKYLEAEEDLNRVLEIREKADGPESPSYAEALTELAWVLVKGGRLAEAEQRCRLSITISQLKLQESDPSLALRWEQLGVILSMQKRSLDAQPAFEKALRFARESLGPDHRITRRIEAEVAHPPIF